MKKGNGRDKCLDFNISHLCNTKAPKWSLVQKEGLYSPLPPFTPNLPMKPFVHWQMKGEKFGSLLWCPAWLISPLWFFVSTSGTVVLPSTCSLIRVTQEMFCLLWGSELWSWAPWGQGLSNPSFYPYLGEMPSVWQTFTFWHMYYNLP